MYLGINVGKNKIVSSLNIGSALIPSEQWMIDAICDPVNLSLNETGFVLISLQLF